MAFVWIKDINGGDHLVHTSQLPPIQPTPDRMDELKKGDTIDIEEYIAMQEVEQAPEVEEVEGVDYHMENEPDTDEDDDDADDGDEDGDEDEDE